MTGLVKRHPLLAEVSSALSGRQPSITKELLGHKYTMKLLKPEAEDWVAMHTDGTTLAATMLNARKPTVAAALASIDDVAIDQLFQPDEGDVKTREMLLANAKDMRDWRREQILDWVREELDIFVTDELYAAYSSMVPKHREAMRAAENFSKETPSLT